MRIVSLVCFNRSMTNTKTKTQLAEAETRNVDAIVRAMGDRHLTKAQRMEWAALIADIYDESAARGEI